MIKYEFTAFIHCHPAQSRVLRQGKILMGKHETLGISKTKGTLDSRKRGRLHTLGKGEEQPL